MAINLKKQFLDQVEAIVQPVSLDPRDPWPASMDAYVVRSVLFKGNFGFIKHVVTTNNDMLLTDGNESRGCILKTVCLDKLFYQVIQEASDTKKPSLGQTKSPEVRLQRIIRRIVMDLLVTTRCRHENILHMHSVFTNAEGLHMAMPRFHVLKDMINIYRDSHDYEPISMAVIARIVRQLCKALNYLHLIGIAHRDVQPEHILMTRNATVKLCHFGQSKALVTDKMKEECRTPVGKEEFMCSEKLFNLYDARSLDDCRSYQFSGDIWSVGVLILSMISYFPNEKFQKLRKDFALVLEKERMPFTWLTSDMVQLRARMLKSGGDDLKSFLNDHILTVNPKKRMTAREIVESERFLKWCSKSITEDKLYLKKKFIGEIDFSNRQKLDVEGSNFDALESKNIPAEFYWDESWKVLEEAKFMLKILAFGKKPAEKCFKFSDPEPMFELVYAQIERNIIGLADIIAIHCAVYEMAFDLIRELETRKKSSKIFDDFICREYNPIQGFLAEGPEPVQLQMSILVQPRNRFSSRSNSLSCSTSFNATS